MKAAKFRKWNNILHRDLGYFFFGLTIIYAVSGFVLNHVKADKWHPDYSISTTEVKIDYPKDKQMNEASAKQILTQFGLNKGYKKFVTSGDNILIFFENGSLTFDTETGDGILEKKTPLYLIREFNFLHYNNIKGLYTYFADIYAVALFIMAITGLFVIKGKKGITGRGAWMTALGLILPILFIIFFY